MHTIIYSLMVSQMQYAIITTPQSQVEHYQLLSGPLHINLLKLLYINAT